MKAGTTRERILEQAELLFAREGIDRVTLRQIGRAANQRNVAAVQYHFGSKQALLDEILQRHLDQIDARRREMLDEQEHSGRIHDVGELMRVLVEPLSDKLGEALGRSYLRIQEQRIAGGEMRPATRLMTSRIGRGLGLRELDPLRSRFATLLLFHALADRAEQEESGESDSRDRRPFVASLMQVLADVFAGAAARPGSEARETAKAAP